MRLAAPIVNALGLPDGDAAPRRIAEAALLAGGYVEPEPVFVLTDDNMTAVRFLCALIERLDALPRGAGAAVRSGMVDGVIEDMLSDETLDALSTLDPYVCPYGQPDGPKIVSVEPLRQLADHVVSIVAAHADK